MDAEDGGDTAGTWGQYKINFARALGLGFDFIATPEVAASAMSKWCKAIEEEAEAALDAKEKAKYLKENGLTDAKDTNTTGGDKAPAGAAPAASQSTSDGDTLSISFKDAAQEAAFNKMLELMAEISAVNPAELDGMINGAVVQLTAKQQKVMKAAMKIAV